MNYDRRAAGSRTATFNITKVRAEVDVDLNPEKLSWTGEGQILVVGKATFLLPNAKYESQPYELTVSEDGTVQKSSCPDPMQDRMIWMAAKARKREMAELIADEKIRGGLRKKP